MNGGPITIEFRSNRMGPSPQLYIVLCSEHMGPFMLSHALNDGPILLIYILFRLEHMGPFSQ